MIKFSIHRKRNAALGLPELIAIALGGMIGGGIFTVLGISAELVGIYTPLAILIGGFLAYLAAYSYCKLGVYFKDEGATYSFFKRVFPRSPFAASLVGWWVTFGYISTIALYAYTFSSYALSSTSFADVFWVRTGFATGIIALFAIINVWSVAGMGRIEDLMVYTKLVVLAIISFVLINNSKTTLPALVQASDSSISILGILIVSSVTFVAFEGFQLVINAVNEMEEPEKNIPRAIYSAIALAIAIYVFMALGAFLSIPLDDLIADKEYALAARSEGILGKWGSDLVIIGALLATSSAISGTLFGASRLMAVISHDGFFPSFLSKRRGRIPVAAILTMSGLASVLIFSGSLQLILEFGSITFLAVSFLMAYANHIVRDKTNSSVFLTVSAMVALLAGAGFICYYEYTFHLAQLLSILSLYAVLTVGAWIFARHHCPPSPKGGRIHVS